MLVSVSLSCIRNISLAGLLAMPFPSIRGRLISHEGPLNRSRRDSPRREPWCLFQHYPFLSAVTQINPCGEETKTERGCVQICPSRLDSTRRRNMLRARRSQADAHVCAETLLHWRRRRRGSTVRLGREISGGVEAQAPLMQRRWELIPFFLLLLLAATIAPSSSSSRLVPRPPFSPPPPAKPPK